MAKLPIVSWIGNAAAVLVGGWGGRFATGTKRQVQSASRLRSCEESRDGGARCDRWRIIARTTPAATTSTGGTDCGTGKTAGYCVLVQTEYCRKLAVNWRESYRRVAAVLRQTVRTSSAVECMNSVLRMHQGRHRTVTQPMLDLKRLYWWQLLRMPPADLTQQVSSSEVAI